MRGVRPSILPNVTLGIRGSVARDNQVLLFALNKAIAVSGAALNEAIIQNAVNAKTDVRTAIENLPPAVTVTAGAVLTLLVVLLIVALVLLARSSKERIALLNREMDIDGLTRAGCRRYVTDLLERELALFQRYGDGSMVAMLDADRFKEKNDTYGHEYGDFVLKKVVEVLQSALRKTDAVIRWGGDEFVLVLPRIGNADAHQLLRRMVNAVHDADFTLDGKGSQITISVGASFFMPGDEEVPAILSRCDSALYEAKTVRNAYRIYSVEDD